LSLPSNSLNSTCFPLPLELIWPFPFVTSTSDPPKLVNLSWKLRSSLYYKIVSNVGVEFFGQSKYHPQFSKWGVSQSLNSSLWNIILSIIESCQTLKRFDIWSITPFGSRMLWKYLQTKMLWNDIE
jgi:hypothetical protein